jgi:hypothetical protein
MSFLYQMPRRHVLDLALLLTTSRVHLIAENLIEHFNTLNLLRLGLYTFLTSFMYLLIITQLVTQR